MFIAPAHFELIETYEAPGGIVFVWRLDGFTSFIVETFAASTVNQ